MKTLINILFIIFSLVLVKAQEAFHNFGNVQIHDSGEVGFHTDVINDGDFDQNLGFTGLYNDTGRLTVSGTNRPVFYDLEIDVEGDLYLEVAVGSRNFQEFVNGKVFTPRNLNEVSLDYVNDTPYLGENDERHVDGYATVTGDLDFTFPVGDDFRLRPIKIENQAAVNTARAAYFFEDPNNPNFFSGRFDTNSYGPLLFGVSIFEFWDLDGDQPTRVTLTWDDNSNIPTLVDDLTDLRVVGWDNNLQQWVNLGNTSITGNLDNGEITSDIIIPDNFTVLTFGSSNSILDGDIEIYNAVSPNGDGLNDFFRIDGLGRFPDNEVSVFNRWGVLVYNRKNYHLVQETDGFKGESEGRVTVKQDEKLPTGTYYYILKIKGGKDRAGYLYVNL